MDAEPMEDGVRDRVGFVLSRCLRCAGLQGLVVWDSGPIAECEVCGKIEALPEKPRAESVAS